MFFAKKFLFTIFFAFILAGPLQPCLAEAPVEFFVLITSYNNAKWAKKNLESVFCQTYPHWRIHYINACSTDGTGDIVERYIRERGFSEKCTVIHKTRRTMASENFYYAIKDCDPHKVVVQLDGDDWLAHDKVLEKLASIYKNKNVWMTYGNYRPEPKIAESVAAPIPVDVIKNLSFRKYRWVYGHLRTFYAALFQKIPKEDFLLNGEFMKAANDVAFAFPLLEMASKGHFLFINEVLYVYNCANPLSDFRLASRAQGEVAAYVCPKPPYKPLDSLF